MVVFPPLLEAFDNDEIRGGGLDAHLLEWGVFRRGIPLVKLLHALKFEDD